MNKEAREATEMLTLNSCTVESPPSADPPARLVLVPWGQVRSTNGDFVVDEESGGLVVAAFVEQGTDLPIDYEHQTLGGPFTSPSGQAPAAGWITRLEAVAGEGIVATVNWTPQAAEQLAARQYRYLSPVALVRKQDRKLVAVHSAALTNKPAIVAMEPIVNRTATPIGEAIEELRGRLGLDAGCDAEVVIVAAGRRLRELDERERLDRADRRVDQALRTGRLTEAQRSWATALILRDESLFDGWLSTAPVVVPLGRTAPPPSSDVPSAAAGCDTRAKAEFRAHPELALLTSEAAYVADALRRR